MTMYDLCYIFRSKSYADRAHKASREMYDIADEIAHRRPHLAHCTRKVASNLKKLSKDLEHVDHK